MVIIYQWRSHPWLSTLLNLLNTLNLDVIFDMKLLPPCSIRLTPLVHLPTLFRPLAEVDLTRSPNRELPEGGSSIPVAQLCWTLLVEARDWKAPNE